jgi:hypothetical protein
LDSRFSTRTSAATESAAVAAVAAAAAAAEAAEESQENIGTGRKQLIELFEEHVELNANGSRRSGPAEEGGGGGVAAQAYGKK